MNTFEILDRVKAVDGKIEGRESATWSLVVGIHDAQAGILTVRDGHKLYHVPGMYKGEFSYEIYVSAA